MNRVGKVAVGLVVAVAVVWLLFNYVFPWVDTKLADPSLDAAPATLDLHTSALGGV
jgi:hypothetical protein